MFTGIVDHCGKINTIKKDENTTRFTIRSDFTDLCLGESIAVDGACLTVTEVIDTAFTVELSPETLRLTMAHGYNEGAKVNLERSLRLTDRLGGHFVTGHVDGICRVDEIHHHQEFVEVIFKEFSSDFKPYLVTKGSIAINGVSLTINDVNETSFKVMLIPHTLQVTNLSNLSQGSTINIEFDYLAKLVLNQINGMSNE